MDLSEQVNQSDPSDIDLRISDAAALLCSRICHDIISPVGAINNGLEVLDETDDDVEMQNFAMDLVRKSARQASAKLQFARMAFGASGSAGAVIDLNDAGEVAKNFIGEEKVTLVWNAPATTLPKNQVKLILNLILIGLAAIPRGGMLEVNVSPDGPKTALITCKGQGARVPSGVVDYFNPAASDPTDPHNVQPYYAGLIARVAGLSVTVEAAEEGIIISVK